MYDENSLKRYLVEQISKIDRDEWDKNLAIPPTPNSRINDKKRIFNDVINVGEKTCS